MGHTSNLTAVTMIRSLQDGSCHQQRRSGCKEAHQKQIVDDHLCDVSFGVWGWRLGVWGGGGGSFAIGFGVLCIKPL